MEIKEIFYVKIKDTNEESWYHHLIGHIVPVYNGGYINLNHYRFDSNYVISKRDCEVVHIMEIPFELGQEIEVRDRYEDEWMREIFTGYSPKKHFAYTTDKSIRRYARSIEEGSIQIKIDKLEEKIKELKKKLE